MSLDVYLVSRLMGNWSAAKLALCNSLKFCPVLKQIPGIKCLHRTSSASILVQCFHQKRLKMPKFEISPPLTISIRKQILCEMVFRIVTQSFQKYCDDYKLKHLRKGLATRIRDLFALSFALRSGSSQVIMVTLTDNLKVLFQGVSDIEQNPLLPSEIYHLPGITGNGCFLSSPSFLSCY